MTTDSLWQEISSAAMLGIQRRPFQPSQAAGELGHLLNTPTVPSSAETDPAPSSAEHRLLRAAALAALYRRAGHLPALASPDFPPPAAEEKWPRCSPQAGRCLEQILGGGYLSLLTEWVEIAAAHRQRAREEHLPALLRQQKILLPLRRSLLPVLGARGRWLAAQNPEWSAFAPSSGEQVWVEGQRSERLACLEDLRAEDPARARDLLASTWRQESPAERLAFLPLLSTNLSMADEPFLESVLADRRKDVRQAAASLLGRLPESRLVRRMTERAQACLTWRTPFLRPSTLEVTLPETCDAAMLRDGIDPRPRSAGVNAASTAAQTPASSNLGEKAWCLVQILSFVPPHVWSDGWDLSPSLLLVQIGKHEWEAALLEGWKEAALRVGDERWLDALLRHELRSGDHKRLLDFFTRLPTPLKERWMVSMLAEFSNLSFDQPASIFLSTCRHLWSPELTQSVASLICQTLEKGSLQPWRWEKLLRDIPSCFHPDLLEPTVEHLSAALLGKDTGDPFAAALLATLEFRLSLHGAFVSDSFPGTNTQS